MMSLLRRMVIVAAIVGGGFGSTLCGDDRDTGSDSTTTIAITVTSNAATPAGSRTLVETLATHLEARVLDEGLVTVVERRQIELALQELALNRSRTADESLQLGKLISADLLVMLELRQSEAGSKPAALLRVVDSKTAAVCGVSVMSDIEATNIEDAAEQFARYVSVISQPQQQPLATVTVAVAPFESIGRFDRLRPLELGIRDLVTARLLSTVVPSLRRRDGTQQEKEQSPTTNPKKTLAERRDYGKQPPFQVLQRANLDQLLRELDLIQSGFADKDRLPATMPDRQAAFLIKGEIDERQVDGKFVIIVRGHLIHAATAKVRDSFEFTALPAELPSKLATGVDQFALTLGVTERPKQTGRDGLVSHEAASLKQLALRDLHRFRRLSPTDFGHRPFCLPGEDTSRGVSRLATPDTPLGRALIQKSIDRLESVLFIHPDDLEAAYGLGFCYSLHEPGLYQPERADDFLRKVASTVPQSELAALSLAYLGEIAFHDRTGRLDRDQRDETSDRLWFAFEQMPVKHRDHRWPRLLELIAATYRSTEQHAALLRKAAPFAEQATKAAPFAEQATKGHRHQLAGQVQRLALGLALRAKDDPVARAAAHELLHRWAEGTDPMLADFGRQGLAAISSGEKNFLAAALQYEESARKLGDATTGLDRHKHDLHLVNAAEHYRLAQQPEVGLRLLKSFKPTRHSLSTLVGLHGYEMAACHEALGDKVQARSMFLNAAEECPLIVPNSDIVQRIAALGGVPLNEQREIDVRYLTVHGKQPITATTLATDGTRLFIAGAGVSMFDVDSETATLLKEDVGKVSALKFASGRLWVGTDGNGLWRYDVRSREWTRFGDDQGLPDLRVTAVAPHGNEVYVGVGSLSSGGLVRIDPSGKVFSWDDTAAPRVAPTHIVVDDKQLLSRTLKTIHEMTFKSEAWTVHKADPTRTPIITPRLFAGTTRVWASSYGRELTDWNADTATNQLFQPAWFAGEGKAGYRVNFIAERNTEQHDEIWFGGQPWDNFVSSGLYRFNRKTQTFQKFSPRDGFKGVYTQAITDGLWLNEKLWLATTQGLCVVTPRPEKQP